MPDSVLYKSIRKGRIKISGKRAKLDSFVRFGDVVELYVNDEFFHSGNSSKNFNSKVSFDIVYEDENILIADKPAGVIVHSDKSEQRDTLINSICAYIAESKKKSPEKTFFTPALCNRLDRNTRGLVIVAKNNFSLKIMNNMIRDRGLKKHYFCLVHGVPKERSGTLKAYLFRDKKLSRVFIKDSPRYMYKEIITVYRLKKAYGNFSFLEVELVTGRTHQIRAHLAFAGHPVLGDGKYGKNAVNNLYGFKYQQLLAYKITFGKEFLNTDLAYLVGREFKSKQKLDYNNIIK